MVVFPNYLSKIVQKVYKGKMIDNLIKILYQNKIDTIVLAKRLKKDEELTNKLREKNFKILNGRILFEVTIIDCVNYVLKKQKKELHNIELTILANEASSILIDNIYMLVEKIKMLHIVTNNIDKFRKLEKDIEEKFGILIRVSNNKRKSLVNSSIIINMDLTEEQINQYYIDPNLINIKEKIKIYSKKFNGINISDYDLLLPKYILNIENDIINDFDKKELYESIIMKEKDLYSAREKIKMDKVQIIDLIGNNGIIDENEYVKT